MRVERVPSGFGLTSGPRSFLDRFFDEWRRPIHAFLQGCEWMPPADIVETERDLRVAVELPGIDMDALEISVSDGLLTIRGNKPQEKREGECVHCSERYFGSFRRSFRITGRVDPEKIDATYKEGILRVIIPKSERGSVKKIEVR